MDSAVLRQAPAYYDLRGTFAVGSSDLAVAEGVAARLGARFAAPVVGYDSWLRRFVAHATSRGMLPELDWQVDRSFKSFAMRSALDETREGDGADIPARVLDQWRAVPSVAQRATEEDHALVKRNLDAYGSCIVYGAPAAIELGDFTRKALVLVNDDDVDAYNAVTRNPLAAEKARYSEIALDARGGALDSIVDALEGFHATSIIERREQREARDAARWTVERLERDAVESRRIEQEEDRYSAAAFARGDHPTARPHERDLGEAI